MEINVNSPKNKKHILLLMPLAFLALFYISLYTKIVPVSHTDKLFGYLNELAVSIIGLAFFFWGFRQWMIKRLIENIPTSKIRSVAMGLAEIVGLAGEKYPLKSPLTGTNCVYYRFTVETEVKDSRGRRYWKKISEGNSTFYFYVEDATGKLLIDPLGAEIMLIPDYQHIEVSGWGRKRYTEWMISPGDYVYVIGTVKKFKNAFDERKVRLNERLQELKSNKERLKEFDKDKDGVISIDEWDSAREKIEMEMLREELENPAKSEDDIVMAKGEMEKTFIISDRDEQDVTRKMKWKSFLGVFLGILIVALMIFSMLGRTEAIKDGFVINWGLFYGLN